MNAQLKPLEADVARPACLMEITRTGARMDAVMEGIMWARLRRMRTRLQEALGNAEHGVIARSIHAIYEALPADRQARVLLSSEFCESYMALDAARKQRPEAGADAMAWDAESARNLCAIHDLVQREKALLDLASGSTPRYLLESRDWVVDSPVGDQLARKDVQGRWTLETRPMLGDCVAVDLHSKVARHHEPRSGVLSQPCIALDEAEQAVVLDKLSRALAGIDRAEPLYGLVIRNFVRRIVVRKSEESTPDVARRFGSEHVPRQPGSLRLLNIHHPELSVEACMESIMHESTHNFLAAWELANGFFVANDYQHRVVSPWSGNPIPNSSYIHAVFVYYVCHRLLKSHLAVADNIDAAARAHVHRRLAVCAAGFLIEQDLSSRLMSTQPLNADIGRMMDDMQADMKREYGYGRQQ
ncbi:hypothetical protein AB839_15600 [Stenotrophomonas sp. DDT-1]|nr:hypothetical protein AB839_15600 [Stenotrophomonas sp. DDT-1]